MGIDRKPTKAEERLNVAFNSMRNVDKILYIAASYPFLPAVDGTRVWAKDAVKEAIGEIKSLLDQVVDAIEGEGEDE